MVIFALTTKEFCYHYLDGLGIKIITGVAEFEYNNSIKVTNELTKSILDQESNETHNLTASKIKLEIRKERKVRVEEQLNDIRSRVTVKSERSKSANRFV